MYSTNVECAGQCLTKLSNGCNAFEYQPSSKVCQLLSADYLYHDKYDTSARDVYIDVSQWALKGIDFIRFIRNTNIPPFFDNYVITNLK